jgi:hypothetical protein
LWFRPYRHEGVSDPLKISGQRSDLRLDRVLAASQEINDVSQLFAHAPRVARLEPPLTRGESFKHHTYILRALSTQSTSFLNVLLSPELAEQARYAVHHGL